MDNEMVRSAVVGADQVINVWEAMNDGCPYFAIFYAKTRSKFFQYNRDDMEAAKEFLRANLNALESSGDNQMFYFNIYAESKPVFGNNNMIASFPFRLNAYQPSASVNGYPANMDTFAKLLNDSHAAQLKMTQEIAELKYANQPLDLWDKISGVLENPGAANAIVPLLQPVIASLMGFFNKISGVPAPAVSQYHAMPAQGIAGPRETETDKDEALDIALDRLEKHGDLVEMMTVLADFADKNPAMFKMYFDGLKQG
jgi:hypothetical protein